MNPVYAIIIYPILFILPAYVANGAPVLFGGGAPVDLNGKFRGKRIFGSHKTIKGLVAGIASGILMGFVESLFPGLGFMLAVGIAQSLGTHAGDLVGSFSKRQAGIKEGGHNIADPYVFVLFALAFSLPLGNFPSYYGILFILILTGIMHRLTNVIAHALKVKDVPW
jgi:CDP-2,3-bis-(O-geranylgeranyl)-sn-glycerol synthase